MTKLVVAGGGPAGAACAILLARAGRDVTLLERTTGPTEKICGEFVSNEALRVLGRLGLDVAGLGGHRIEAMRLIRGRQCAQTLLPFAAVGVSRGRLDEALLQHAARSGVQVRRGSAIVRAEAAARSTRLVLAASDDVEAETLFLATGKHDLRGLRRDAKAEDLVGFKMHFALSPAARRALSGHVEVIVFANAYAGLQHIEDGRSNLCLLVRRAFLEACGGTWEALLDRLVADNAHLRRRLTGAVPLLDRPLSIFRVPYGFVHAAGPQDRGVFRLGDQAAVIPSFSGDGMAIALHSATLAASMFLDGCDAQAYHRQLRRDVGSQIGRAWALYRLGATRPGQAGLMAVASVAPRILRTAASLTRVPPRAVARAAA